jgi:excisionase family DNA binding protein
MAADLTTWRLLTKQETAELLRVSLRTLERLVVADVLRPVVFVLRGRWRFRTEDVERLLGGPSPSPEGQ